MKKKCKKCGEEFEELRPPRGVTFIPYKQEYCEKCLKKIG